VRADATWRACRRARHVSALVVVEAQDAGERGEHRCGRLHAALLKPGVVVDRDRRELGDLLAAKPDDASLCPAFGKTDVARVQLGAACAKGRRRARCGRCSVRSSPGFIVAEALASPGRSDPPRQYVPRKNPL
jgi:hypothetical protein